MPVTREESRKFDVTSPEGLANWIDLHLEMFGNIALSRLLDMLESMTPDVYVWKPRDWSEFIIREIDNAELYVNGKTIRVTKFRSS